MKRIVLAGFLGGLAMFAWGAVSHMVLHIGEIGVQAVPAPPADQPLLDAIKQVVPEPGFYFLPGMDPEKLSDPDAMADFQKRAEPGPYGLLILHRDGGYKGMGTAFAGEVVSDLALALLAAFLLSCTLRCCKGYPGRVLFVTLLGLVASFRVVQNWSWYGYPTDYTAALVLDAVLGFAVMGLVIAAIVKPAPEAAA